MLDLPLKHAFVLHTRKYKERQMLVDLLVLDQGRITVVANKGSGKNTTVSALLQPFRPLQIKYKEGHALHSLKLVEPSQSSSQSDYALAGTALYCGFYLNELVTRLCKSDVVIPELFPLYVYALQQLQLAENSEQSALKIEAVLRQFEYRLLSILGYAISLQFDINNQSINLNTRYHLSADLGFMKSDDSQGYLGEHILICEQLLDQQLEQQTLDKTHLQVAKQIMRSCLAPHLGNKPLKSRELFIKF